MKLRMLLCGLVFAGISAVITSHVLSQDEGKGQAEGEAGWAEMMKYAKPGEHHKHLNALVGSWNLNVKHRMEPDAEWMEEKSTSEVKWILGGRFLEEVAKGTEAGPTGVPFEGKGFFGYDNFKKKYVSTWADNMSTSIFISYGTCDESGKTITLTGRGDNVFTGKSNQQFKSIVRIINDNKHVFEWWGPSLDGKDYQMMEITYTRK